MMGKVFIFLADGFEEIEGLTVVDMLRRAEIPTVTVSIGSSKNIIGAHRIEVEADIMFHEVLEAEGAMYVLPGGMPGTLHLKDHEGLGKLLQKAYKNVKSRYEKYNDIHNGGEATEREENLLIKYSEQLERLESVLSSIDEISK